jgi:signal peptidase I
MLPRMMIGDYLFVAKWPYGFSRYSMPFGLGDFDGRVLAGQPERGDVAVFREPGGGSDDIVKRTRGAEGAGGRFPDADHAQQPVPDRRSRHAPDRAGR